MLSLHHTIPIFGRREVKLYDEAEEIYKFLEDRGQVFRLKNLNQLGVISEVIHTAHHPKFEYIFLLLLLIEEIKPLKGVYPLSRNVIRAVSGLELMKAWAILLAIGHMPGTFPVEKAMLKLFRNNEILRKQFLKPIREQSHKDYCNRLINGQEVYKFYHAISFYKIGRYVHNQEQKVLSKKMAELLSLYAFDNTLKCVDELRILFNRLRTISYIILDSHYTGGTNIFNLANLQQLNSIIDNESFNNLVKCYDDYLRNQVYRHPKSIVAESFLYTAYYEKLFSHDKPLELINNHLYTSEDANIYGIFHGFLKKHKIQLDDFNETLVVSTTRSNIFEQEEQLVKAITKNKGKNFKEHQILFNIDSFPGKMESAISIYSSVDYNDCPKKLIVALVRTSIAEVLKNELSGPLALSQVKKTPSLRAYFKKQINERNIKNIFKTVFRTLFDDRVSYFKFIPRSAGLNLPEALYEKKQQPYLIESLIKDHKIKDDEVLMLCESLKKLTREEGKQSFLLLTSNVEFHTKLTGHLIIGEIDGALLELSNKEIILYFIESKDTKKGKSESVKQLRRLRKYFRPSFRDGYKTRISRLDKADRGAIIKVRFI